jgi:hypothetical protein
VRGPGTDEEPPAAGSAGYELAGPAAVTFAPLVAPEPAAELEVAVWLLVAVPLLDAVGEELVGLGAPLVGGCVVGDCEGAAAEDAGGCGLGVVGGWGSG